MIMVVQQIFLFYFWFRFSSAPSSKQKVLYHINSRYDMIRAMLIGTKYSVFTKGCECLTDMVNTESLSDIFFLDKYFL